MLISSPKYQKLSLVAPLLDVVNVILLFDLTRFYHVDKVSHLNEKRIWAGNKSCMQNIMLFAYPAETSHICQCSQCISKNWKWNSL
jgi:hypothetical protein